jgi:murein DD-endopeptidase MepM/ murein hydrolase activator NlpD
VRLFSLLTFPSPRTYRAAVGARAALNGVPLGLPTLPASFGGAQARISTLARRRISLRYAAHLLTIGIVLVAAISAQGFVLDGTGTTAADTRSVIGAASSDMLVERRMVVGGEVDAAQALPAVRAPLEEFAPAFPESHMLVEGETLGQVAAQYQVDVASLFWANDLADGNVFAAGQELRIPRSIGIPHIIAEGETLDSLAARFQVDPQAIVLFKSNGVREGLPLPAGREIFIPGGAESYPAEMLAQLGGEQGIAMIRAVAAGVVQDTDTNLRSGPGRDYPRLGMLDAGRRLKLLARHETWVKVEDGAGVTGWVRGDLLGLSETTITGLTETSDFPPPPLLWVWPTRGEITSPFGWRRIPYRSFHDGLDIANRAGTKIYAARSGRVVESGWCSGFGYCVKIDHGDGMTSIYGHLLRRPPVKAGVSVDAGDLIGLMGSTYDARGGGYSTGVHLHFTLKLNGKAINPLKFLP